MKGNYPDDTFTEADVLNALSAAGLRYQNKGRYILSRCPTHEDKHPSVQIYKDDWFVNCHATCGRYHITKAFPDLRGEDRNYSSSNRQRVQRKKEVTEKKYVEYDLMENWEVLPLIPEDHKFKNLPIEHLNAMGWRWMEKMNAYFIPYFNRPKTKIPFAQYRYLSGDVRFRFLKDAKPTMYGTWNLEPKYPVFLVEGTSDAVVLDYCAIPAIAMPSASSGALMRPFGEWCVENDVTIIYAGDNDEAGEKLREALDEVAPYRVWQPPKKYKDWADFFVAEGQEAVIMYCNKELNPLPETLIDEQNRTALEILGGSELEVENGSKEQSVSQQELF